MMRSLVSVAALLAAVLVVPGAEAARLPRTASWGPSMTIGGPNFANQTIRMVVHTSVGGKSLRIKLSNQRSTTPLAIGAADVAMQADRATAVAGSRHEVTFSRSRTVTIPAGAEVFSDPVPMNVAAESGLLISLFLPQATSSSTWHSDAFDTTYLSRPGNYAADDEDGDYIRATTSWYYLSGLEVASSTVDGSVVAFGDSITDGFSTPVGAYRTWPNDLARRLAGSSNPFGVVNAGIGGNRVLTDSPFISQGVSATKRFAHDALGQPGVRDVILLEGINDIGNNAGPNGAPLTARDLVDGYRDLIAQAHASGVRIIGGTVLPDFGAGYYSAATEAIRQAANDWIRTSGAFDGVVDFDKAIRDPANPAAMTPTFDSGDHLHPNEAGMQAMADSIDLALLR